MNSRALRWTYVLADWIATSVAWTLFNLVRHAFRADPHSLSAFYHLPQVIGGQILFPLVMLGVYWLSGYYNNPTERSRTQDFLTTLGSALVGAVIIFFLAVVNDFEYRRRVAIELLAILTGLMFVFVLAERLWISYRLAGRGGVVRPAVMIGDDDESRRLIDSLNSRSNGGVTVSGIIDPAKVDPVEYCREHGISRVIISPLVARTERMSKLVGQLMPADLTVFVSPDLNEFRSTSGRVGDVTAEPLIDITRPRISESTVNIKRLIDVVASSVALVLLSPLMLGIAVAVKHSSPGPVIYRQRRMGHRKREFTIYKFRSMCDDAEAQSGPVLTQRNDDPRITSVGRFLRKYRLDELPQFWNVLTGSMSLVGPRPERRVFADRIAERVPVYSIIYQVRPGITSWGMVKYGYASSVDQMIERLRYDLIYMENISVTTDLKILIHTVKTVLTGRGK